MGALHGVIYVTGVHTQHTARKIGHIALCVKVSNIIVTGLGSEAFEGVYSEIEAM